MKDTLVITARGSGAEILPYLKLWGILPAALFSTWVYTRLITRFSHPQAFRILIGAFLAFFLAFVTVLYPFREQLHPHLIADQLELVLPSGFKGLIAMFRNWTFTAFYIMAELWGSILLSVMFWGLANEITRLADAHRFYGVFALASNSAAMSAGLAGILLAQPEYNPWIPFGSDAWEQTQFLFILTVLIAGLAMLALYHRIFKAQAGQLTQSHPKAKKRHLSFFDSFRFLVRSPYLAKIACLTIGYNLTINLVEVLWKDQLRLLYPDRVAYNTYMANITLGIGLISLAVSCPISWLLHRCGWTFTALLTPVIMGVASLGFFGTLFLDGWVERLGVFFHGMQPLVLTVFFGGAQCCLSKAAKYSVFDASREMAFIPLAADVKRQGKAAIDGVGSRVAKSGSSALLQALLMCFGTLSACAPVIAVVVFTMLGLWIYCVQSLGHQFKSLQEHHDSEAASTEDVEAVRAAV